MMRVWGRIGDQWIPVETAANGDNSEVYLVNLVQVLKLGRNESPFFANYGIPAVPSVVSQIQPDIYVAQTQQQFAGYFAALLIAKQNTLPPTYALSVTTLTGASLSGTLPQ